LFKPADFELRPLFTGQLFFVRNGLLRGDSRQGGNSGLACRPANGLRPR